MNAISQLDWPLLARGALWISGLSLLLAAWSHASWWASDRGTRLREAIGRRGFVAPFWFGLALFTAAMAWSPGPVWQRAAWAVLAALSTVSFIRSLRP
jgi:hypothetical protein